MTDIDLDTLIAKGVQVELRDKPAVWAEHSVRVKTVARSQRDAKPAEQKRIGLFIGISEYADDRIPDLSLCHTDATVMAEVMKQVGRLHGIGLLVNQQATRKAIEQAFDELKQKSKPGDEVFIYWSGHGASCADANGDERDGRDEYLVLDVRFLRDVHSNEQGPTAVRLEPGDRLAASIRLQSTTTTRAPSLELEWASILHNRASAPFCASGRQTSARQTPVKHGRLTRCPGTGAIGGGTPGAKW